MTHSSAMTAILFKDEKKDAIDPYRVQLENAGFAVDFNPVLQLDLLENAIQDLQSLLEQKPDAVLLTSPRAAEAVCVAYDRVKDPEIRCQLVQSVQWFVLGFETMNTLKCNVPVTNCCPEAANAEDLASTCLSFVQQGKLGTAGGESVNIVFPCGSTRRNTVLDILKVPKVSLTEICVYESMPKTGWCFPSEVEFHIRASAKHRQSSETTEAMKNLSCSATESQSSCTVLHEKGTMSSNDRPCTDSFDAAGVNVSSKRTGGQIDQYEGVDAPCIAVFFSPKGVDSVVAELKRRQLAAVEVFSHIVAIGPTTGTVLRTVSGLDTGNEDTVSGNNNVSAKPEMEDRQPQVEAGWKFSNVYVSEKPNAQSLCSVLCDIVPEDKPRAIHPKLPRLPRKFGVLCNPYRYAKRMIELSKANSALPTWMYYSTFGSEWLTFSVADGLKIESAFLAQGPVTVAVDRGRRQVNLETFTLHTVYWESEPCAIRRATWFHDISLYTTIGLPTKKSSTNPVVPLHESVALKLEEMLQRQNATDVIYFALSPLLDTDESVSDEVLRIRWKEGTFAKSENNSSLEHDVVHTATNDHHGSNDSDATLSDASESGERETPTKGNIADATQLVIEKRGPSTGSTDSRRISWTWTSTKSTNTTNKESVKHENIKVDIHVQKDSNGEIDSQKGSKVAVDVQKDSVTLKKHKESGEAESIDVTKLSITESRDLEPPSDDHSVPQPSCSSLDIDPPQDSDGAQQYSSTGTGSSAGLHDENNCSTVSSTTQDDSAIQSNSPGRSRISGHENRDKVSRSSSPVKRSRLRSMFGWNTTSTSQDANQSELLNLESVNKQSIETSKTTCNSVSEKSTLSTTDERNKMNDEAKAKRATRIGNEVGEWQEVKCKLYQGFPTKPTKSERIPQFNKDELVAVSHLVLVVHGMGESLWSQGKPRTATEHGGSALELSTSGKDVSSTSAAHSVSLSQGHIVQSVDLLRDKAHEHRTKTSSAATQSSSNSLPKRNTLQGATGGSGRVEFLPIEWHKSVREEEMGKQMRNVSLPNVPRLREFVHDVLLDVVFYAWKDTRDKILNATIDELNRVYNLFCKNNPGFLKSDGSLPKVSILAHSLGSVISWDLLSTSSERLDFAPQNFFALGSPIACFHTARTQGQPLGNQYALPNCRHVYNIFHPHDPIAYRIEPLLDPELSQFSPSNCTVQGTSKLIHKHLANAGKRLSRFFHGALTSTTSSSVPAGTVTTHDEEDQTSAETASQVASDDELKERHIESSQPMDKRHVITGTRLNMGEPVDYKLQESAVSSITSMNEYLSSLVAHTSYWTNDEMITFVLSKLH